MRDSDCVVAVRYAPETVATTSKALSPFTLHGAPNVFLETVKRGEVDYFGPEEASSKRSTTIILRFYEAYGGHAHLSLDIADHISVASASIANLLEDETERLTIRSEGVSRPQVIQLNFHAFEVKTVKLVVGPKFLVEQSE